MSDQSDSLDPVPQAPPAAAEGEPVTGSLAEEVAARQSELDLGVVPTGDARVDAALTQLNGLVDRPVDDHPAVYERVHQQLQAALADVPDQSG